MKLNFTNKPKKVNNTVVPYNHGKPAPEPMDITGEVFGDSEKTCHIRGNERFKATCPFCGVGQVWQVVGVTCKSCNAVVVDVGRDVEHGKPVGWPQAFMKRMRK